MCANILIDNGTQVIMQGDWMQKMRIDRIDTGNSMTESEMAAFSHNIDGAALFAYRNQVAVQTRKILAGLSKPDIARKPTAGQLARLVAERSVLADPDAIWLLDFWGKKNVGGLLMMPITRHQILHLNDCKEIIRLARQKNRT
ncbi:hypothetical protein [Musicola paradisiaca]|nr:hypothetical protein [Musicola paradisiaca]